MNIFKKFSRKERIIDNIKGIRTCLDEQKVIIDDMCDRQVKLNNFRSFILNSWTFKNGRTMSHTITVPI